MKYKKGVSTAKKLSKSGFNYTQGGFWFEKLNDLDKTKIIIKKMDGSPEVDVRVIIDEIELSNNIFLKELGVIPTLFAYPYGETNEKTINLLKKYKSNQ